MEDRIRSRSTFPRHGTAESPDCSSFGVKGSFSWYENVYPTLRTPVHEIVLLSGTFVARLHAIANATAPSIRPVAFRLSNLRRPAGSSTTFALATHHESTGWFP